MRGIIALSALALASACAPSDSADVQSSVDELAAPPLSTLSLTISTDATGGQITRGEPVEFVVTNLNPNQRVFIGASQNGPGLGTCPSWGGGNCIDILPPYRLAFVRDADAGGNVFISSVAPELPVPAGNWWFQAITANPAPNESNVASLTLNDAVVTTCPDDGFEPNNDLAGAVPAPSTSFSGNICVGDNDFYTITLQDGDVLDVTVLYTHIDGEDDIDLTLYDGTGTAVDGSGGVDGTEALNYINSTGGPETVTIELFPWDDTDGGDGIAYDFSYSISTLSGCADDALEPNDDAFTATALPSQSETGLSICTATDDHDWYTVNLAAGERITVNATFSTVDLDLDVYITDVPEINDEAAIQAVALAEGFSGSDNEVVEYTNLTGGAQTIYVVTRGWSGAADGAPTAGGAVYDMAYTIDLPVTCADDALEPNDDAFTAGPLPSQSETGLTICAGSDDHDWFTVSLADGERLTVNETFSATDYDLDVYILDVPEINDEAAIQAIAVGGDAGGADNAVAEYTNLTGGTQTVYVVTRAWSGSADGAPLVGGGTYDVSYTVDVPTVCAPDAFEPNDDAFAAGSLAAGLYTGLSICISTDDHDWFTVDLLDGETVEANLYFLHADMDLDLYIMDAAYINDEATLDAAFLARGWSADDNEFATYTNATGGTQTVWIGARSYDFGADGGPLVDGAAYDLDFSVF